MMLTIEELFGVAGHACAGIADGEGLRPCEAELIRFAVLASCTSLSEPELSEATAACLDAGATVEQLTEMLAMASGLGVHSLMAVAPVLLREAGIRGALDLTCELDAARAELWQRHVGEDPFWIAFQRELPGFLDALLRLSPSLFVGFFDYCAIPWKMGTVRARTKELAALACDANPSHRFEPGFRVHLANAISLGISPRSIRETLEIASSLPEHSGFRTTS